MRFTITFVTAFTTLSSIATPSVAENLSCRMTANDGRVMTPVFSSDGTWATPRQHGTYQLVDGSVQFAFSDGRVRFIRPNGQIYTPEGVREGRVRPRNCAARVRDHAQ